MAKRRTKTAATESPGNFPDGMSAAWYAARARMTVVMREVSTIAPYEKNPRKNDAAVARVAESIRRFGFQQPLVLDADGTIIVGHTRYKAALSLELRYVPCVVAEHLSAEEVKAYRIADNKLNELAEWDDELLKLELGDLSDLDFPLTDLGFSAEELQGLMGDDAPSGDAAADPEGDVAITSRFQVVVETETEEQQAKIFEEMKGRGYKCRLLTM